MATVNPGYVKLTTLSHTESDGERERKVASSSVPTDNDSTKHTM